jgi:hypothetical protein
MSTQTRSEEKSAAARVAAGMDSYTLRHVRRTIEAEMLAAVAAGVSMTQAHIGQIELMTAAGSELYRRGELLDPPPYVEVDQETVLGDPATVMRLQRAVRVF